MNLQKPVSPRSIEKQAVKEAIISLAIYFPILVGVVFLVFFLLPSSQMLVIMSLLALLIIFPIAALFLKNEWRDVITVTGFGTGFLSFGFIIFFGMVFLSNFFVQIAVFILGIVSIFAWMFSLSSLFLTEKAVLSRFFLTFLSIIAMSILMLVLYWKGQILSIEQVESRLQYLNEAFPAHRV